jgi:hypothetical protein
VDLIPRGARYGGGFTQIGPPPGPFAIAGIVEVEWEETNRRRRLGILLEDEDGHPLNVPTPAGDQPFKIGTQFDVGRPPGQPPGISFSVPLAMMVATVPWTPGRRYIVKLLIDGATMDQVAFSVRRSRSNRHPPELDPRWCSTELSPEATDAQDSGRS